MEITDNLTQILTAIISLASVLITVVVVPYIQSRTTLQQQQAAIVWVNRGVQAAEQLFPAYKSGEAKLEYVQEFMAKLGYRFTKEQIRILIEAAVKDLPPQTNWIANVDTTICSD